MHLATYRVCVHGVRERDAIITLRPSVDVTAIAATTTTATTDGR
jgi:hypothetical protein